MDADAHSADRWRIIWARRSSRSTNVELTAGSCSKPFPAKRRGCTSACRSSFTDRHAAGGAWPIRSTRRAIDELGFVVKKDIQLVVADPAEIEKAIDKYYGEEAATSVADILKELGADEEIAEEVSEVADGPMTRR